MRFARRLRTTPSPDGPAPGAAATASEQVPAGAVVAAYAAVLDGAHLWVAVEEQPGALALRDRATGTLLPGGAGEAADSGTSYLSAGLALPEAHDTDARIDVVLTDPGGRGVRPLWTPPIPVAGVPAAPDGHHRWVLHRDPDGLLCLQAEEVLAAATLRAVSVTPGALTLRCEPPRDLTLVVDRQTTTLGADPDGRVVLTAAAVNGLPVGPVAVVAEPDRRAVRRHHDALADPRRAAPLPELVDPGTGRTVLRLHWSNRGLLEAEVPAAVAGERGGVGA